MHRLTLSYLICLLAATLGGCGKMSMRLPSWSNPAPVAVAAEPGTFTLYPGEAKRGDDWDVVVIQGRDHITLDNRTARAYTGLQLWLNQQYVADVDTIAIGSGNRIPLTRFVNRHGESYPVAALLSPDTGFPVLSVEAYDPADGMRHRMLARP
jgi:hypothetical protein